MVAFSGADAIGVLIGAKRPSGTLVYKIAVHPDHRRQGHGRHLLASLGSKLAILGPPRMVAEIPQALAPACELFRASGYVQEARLTDYVLHPEHGHADMRKGFVIPVTVDDLSANGLFADSDRQVSWGRSVESLSARKDGIGGFAVASDERIEAYVLYLADAAAETEIVSLRSFIDDGGARFAQLFAHLRARGMETLRLSKVHPAEMPDEWRTTLGLRPVEDHLVYAATARAA